MAAFPFAHHVKVTSEAKIKDMLGEPEFIEEHLVYKSNARLSSGCPREGKMLTKWLLPKVHFRRSETSVSI